MPVRPRTSAMTGAIRGSATPSAWWPALAGLVRGPRKLKRVGTPSSRRGTAAWRNEGWKTGAKQKPMPTSSTVAATPSGGRAMTTPSASSRSALPQRPEAARLPCLATRWPAPTAPSAARAGTFKVPPRPRPAPAGAAGVEPRPGRPERRGHGQHGPDQPGDLGRGLPLDPQGGGERGDLGRGGLPGQDRAHSRAGPLLAQVLTAQQGPEHGGPGEQVGHSALPGHIDAVGAKPNRLAQYRARLGRRGGGRNTSGGGRHGAVE